MSADPAQTAATDPALEEIRVLFGTATFDTPADGDVLTSSAVLVAGVPVLAAEDLFPVVAGGQLAGADSTSISELSELLWRLEDPVCEHVMRLGQDGQLTVWGWPERADLQIFGRVDAQAVRLLLAVVAAGRVWVLRWRSDRPCGGNVDALMAGWVKALFAGYRP